MWDTIAIIMLLGGLETLLWCLERKRQRVIEKEDSIQQAKQLELLDGILTELAIANTQVEEESIDA